MTHCFTCAILASSFVGGHDIPRIELTVYIWQSRLLGLAQPSNTSSIAIVLLPEQTTTSVLTSRKRAETPGAWILAVTLLLLLLTYGVWFEIWQIRLTNPFEVNVCPLISSFQFGHLQLFLTRVPLSSKLHWCDFFQQSSCFCCLSDFLVVVCFLLPILLYLCCVVGLRKKRSVRFRYFSRLFNFVNLISITLLVYFR